MGTEFLAGFADVQLKVFFDGTLGLGGHAEMLLEAHPEIERYIGCDRDVEALKKAGKRLEKWKDKLVLVHGGFADLAAHLEEIGIERIDGAFFDLGVSSMQLDTAEKGFSFMRDGPLDMRMDKSQELTAASVVNTYSREALEQILWEYGEERHSRGIVDSIVRARANKKIERTLELAEIIVGGRGRGKIHPATQTFQALRIEVNDELGQVKRGVESAIDKLTAGGVIGVITFHSLEDRIVKELFRTLSYRSSEEKKKDVVANLSLINKKPWVPTPAECRKNKRSRSAKMRFAKKN